MITAEQKQNATDLLVAELRAPVFFHKLANDYGIQPRDADEANEMLRQAGKIRTLYEIKNQKVAATNVTLLKRSAAHLDKLLAEVGMSPTDAQTETEIKRAAATVAGRPELVEAILTLQAAAQVV